MGSVLEQPQFMTSVRNQNSSGTPLIDTYGEDQIVVPDVSDKS